MDGVHDLGGMQDMGAVELPEPDEPAFHEPWEGRIFAIGALSQTRLTGANLDAFRFAIDRTPPHEYLGLPYYNRWLRMAETLLTESGVIAPGAIDARVRRRMGEAVEEPPVPEPSKPDYKPTGPGSLRQVDDAPKFGTGARVRTVDAHTAGHTRLPRYARRREGTVTQVRPAMVLPDTNAHFIAENAQHVYTVAFDSTELWGPEAERFTTHLDLYESYLEAV
jgi:nitrile hydratase beta subunit